jgi:phage terminase small subunit
MPQVHEAPLTIKERKFVAAYLGEAERNGCKAAEIAGYKYPDIQASRVLARVRIQQCIERADEKVDQRLIMSIEERKATLSKIAKEGEDRDKIKSVDVLNRMDSVYVDRQHVSFDGYDNEKLNEESAKILQTDGWICFPPDHPRAKEARELLE